MERNDQSHWRSMFERDKHDRQPRNPNDARPASPKPMPSSGYDDGYEPAQQAAAPLSPSEVTDEAAMALADDAQEYRPWILQRGSRPLMMLHLRRFDIQAGHWIGWQVSYPHLIAVEYVGDKLLSLDFGSRNFIIEGTGLGELARHLQTAAVQAMVEFTTEVWGKQSDGALIRGIRCVTS